MSEDVERVALDQAISGAIPDDLPGYRQRYTERAIDAILAAGFHVTPTPQWSVEFTEPLNGERVTWLFEGESEARYFAQTDDTSGNYKHAVIPPSAPIASVLADAKALSEYHSNRLSRMVEQMTDTGYSRNLKDIIALNSTIAFLDREAGR